MHNKGYVKRKKEKIIFIDEFVSNDPYALFSSLFFKLGVL